jgi:hypothetical protein
LQEFSNFEILQFVKNTKFSKFSQNLSFYHRVQKKRLYNLHKESPKNFLTGIGEPMVPTFGGLANIDPKMVSKFLTPEFLEEFQNFKILSMRYTKLAQSRLVAKISAF